MFRLSSGLRAYVSQYRNSCPVLGGDRGKGVSPLDDHLKRDRVRLDVWEERSGTLDMCETSDGGAGEMAVITVLPVQA